MPFSLYVPGDKIIVSPDCAPAIACAIVGKSEGTFFICASILCPKLLSKMAIKRQVIVFKGFETLVMNVFFSIINRKKESSINAIL